MAESCPIGFDVAELRRQVAETYAQVARDPNGDYHFHRGPDYAAELLGYDRAELATLPERCTAPFAGVANPLALGPVHPGETVLDVGSGSGMDLLLAARRVGPGGRAIGVDLTAEMRELATANAREAGLDDRVTILEGHTDELPVDDGSVDLVISNGVLNLSPDKRTAFGEIFRVLKPSGRLYLGDVVIGRDLSERARSDVDLWAA
jgi:arsenite methyltransferase